MSHNIAIIKALSKSVSAYTIPGNDESKYMVTAKAYVFRYKVGYQSETQPLREAAFSQPSNNIMLQLNRY